MFTVKCIEHNGNISGIECSSYSIRVVSIPNVNESFSKIDVRVKSETPSGPFWVPLIVGPNEEPEYGEDVEHMYSRIVIENSHGKTVQNLSYNEELGSLSII